MGKLRFDWDGKDVYSRVLINWCLKHQETIWHIKRMRRFWGLEWEEIRDNLGLENWWLRRTISFLAEMMGVEMFEEKFAKGHDSDLAEAIRYVREMRRAA